MTEYIYCERCCSRHPANAKFCVKCGNRLRTQKANKQLIQQSESGNNNDSNYGSSSRFYATSNRPKLTEEQIQTFAIYVERWQNLARWADANYKKQHPHTHATTSNKTTTAPMSSNSLNKADVSSPKSAVDKNTAKIGILAAILVLLICILVIIIAI